MESFKHDTYVVLDLPESVADRVKKIRNENNYTRSLPTEITVAGSSGIGVLQHEQNPAEVYSTIKEISSQLKPIKASFGEVDSFPSTDIYFLTLQDERPIREFHEKLVKSNIEFTENPFPYKPHCTLSNNSTHTDKEIQELLSKEVNEEFTLDTVSVYSLERKSPDEINVSLLRRFQLSG